MTRTVVKRYGPDRFHFTAGKRYCGWNYSDSDPVEIVVGQGDIIYGIEKASDAGRWPANLIYRISGCFWSLSDNLI